MLLNWLFMLAAVAPVPPARSIISSPYLVVPGRNLGRLHLGADAATALTSFGPAAYGDAAMQKAWSTWFGQGHPPSQLDVYTTLVAGSATARKAVQAIRATSPAFHLADGLRVGATLRQIRAHYKPLPLATTYRLPAGPRYLYDDVRRGIAFELDGRAAGSHCRALLVHMPGQAAATLYLAPGSYLPEVPVRR